MKVLVTGGSGFIGSHVVDRLAELGYSPVIFDRRGWLRPNAETMLGDIRDATAITEAAAHVDGIIHLAGVLGTQETISNPYPAAETNILGGINVLQAIRQYELPATYICVGNYWMNNSYSITKTTTERFAQMFNKELGTQVAVVRALNAYGPGQALPTPYGESKVRKIMPSFIGRAIAGDPIEVYGDGSQIMDMIYVEDVAKILVDSFELAVEGLVPNDFTFEAGTGRVTTVKQIAEIVINTVGQGEIVHLPMRPGEPENSTVIADPSTLERLGWYPDMMVPLEDGVASAVTYFRAAMR